MTEDIVDRLRAAACGHPLAKINWPHYVLHEAAYEIEKLRAEKAALRHHHSQMRYDALEEAAALIEDELWRGSKCANRIRALANKDDLA